jgi:hypothetical protein
VKLLCSRCELLSRNVAPRGLTTPAKGTSSLSCSSHLIVQVARRG